MLEPSHVTKQLIEEIVDAFMERLRNRFRPRCDCSHPSWVIVGTISAEIVLEIAPNIEAVSVITRSSAEALQLKVGRHAYVTIKSSDVMVAVDD